jgi:hypothetical protein
MRESSAHAAKPSTGSRDVAVSNLQRGVIGEKDEAFGDAAVDVHDNGG